MAPGEDQPLDDKGGTPMKIVPNPEAVLFTGRSEITPGRGVPARPGEPRCPQPLSPALEARQHTRTMMPGSRGS